jgi:hypothetical protein
VVGDLGREVNGDAKRDAQNIQNREQRMAAQVTENVPAENAKILNCHRGSAASQLPWRCMALSQRHQGAIQGLSHAAMTGHIHLES